MKKIIKGKRVFKVKKRGKNMNATLEKPETLINYLNNEDLIFINGMKSYIKELKALPPEKAKQEAEKALFRTGVTDENGKVKENIVSWE
ncbi:MAG: hypothetical protein HFJ96_03415 [Peptococcaceae bacterium]|jgi:hypothetical protein|nr:hypothetical protein [Peptococcaceae bacterium]